MDRPEPCVLFSQTFVHNQLDEYVDEVEKPNRARREHLLSIFVAASELPDHVDLNLNLGDIAAMTYGYTEDDIKCLVKRAVDLSNTRKSPLHKMDFIEVVKQFLDATMKKAKLQNVDKGVVSEVRTVIENLKQPRVQGSLHELLLLEPTLEKRLKYQNIKIRNYVLRRLEMIWNSCGIYCCWFPYMAMKLFDCLPPLRDEDVDLVVLCCLTLACKIQKKRFHTTRFLLEMGLVYNLEEVVAMELNLLRSLQWKTRQLTPFCFLQCLANDLTASCNMRLIYSVIVWTQANMTFADFSPSTIAYSAILCTTRCEDSIMIRKLHEVEYVDECTNFMEALYGTKLSNLRAEPRSTNEESSHAMNIALEWIEQLPSSETKAGICESALGCLFPLLQCFKIGPSTETNSSGPSTETNSAGPSTETNSAGPSTETNSAGPSTETNSAGPSTETNSAGPSTETNSAGPSTETNSAEINTSEFWPTN